MNMNNGTLHLIPNILPFIKVGNTDAQPKVIILRPNYPTKWTFLDVRDPLYKP